MHEILIFVNLADMKWPNNVQKAGSGSIIVL